MVLKKGRIGAIKAGLGFIVPNFEIIIAIMISKMTIIETIIAIMNAKMAVMNAMIALMVLLFQ
jgi:hypothetical protein